MSLEKFVPDSSVTRRQFFRNSVCTGTALVGVPTIVDGQTIDHREALRRRKRRITVQHDVYHVMRNYSKLHGADQAPFDLFRDAVFSYVDEPGSQIDAIWWDIGGNTVGAVYPSDVLPPVEHPLLKSWLGKGVDWVAELVNETRRRKLEVFWNHRISAADGYAQGGLNKTHLHPLKKAHPDWTTPCWWWQGMWNLAAEGLREHKIAELRELATRYDLDGIQIDFARHIPCLPAGKQWEMREHVTEFMRMLREMLDEVGQTRGRPLLVAARVPRNLKGCRADGFDIAAWGDQKLVDILTLGSRSMDVDVEDFRKTAGDSVQLQPCFDDHHATDGYRYGSIDFLHGVFSNYWQRGANSVMTFNWSIGTPEVAKSVGGEIGPLTQQVAYREIGDLVTMTGKNKMFAVERRGGYPWADGFLNRNDTAVLPALLPEDGKAIKLLLHISDGPSAANAILTLRCILFQAASDDSFDIRINDVKLAVTLSDSEWKDAQIFSPSPQRTSGGTGQYKINPNQQLLRLDCTVPNEAWKQGANRVAIRLLSRANDAGKDLIQLEKLEAHLRYG